MVAVAGAISGLRYGLRRRARHGCRLPDPSSHEAPAEEKANLESSPQDRVFVWSLGGLSWIQDRANCLVGLLFLGQS